MSFSNDQPQLANQLPISIDFSKQGEVFHGQLTDLYKRIANSVNTRQLGFYFTQETSAGQEFFVANDPQNRRYVYRSVIDFGALPNTGTTTVAHNISFDSDYRLTHLYGASTDPVNLLYIPLPYASPTLANNIELSLDGTNVIVTTGSNRSAFTTTYIVAEYVKVV